MFLAIAATENEMAPFTERCPGSQERYQVLVSGVGPLESAVSTSRFLERNHTKIRGVVNFGIGGAYLPVQPGQGANILGLCLAQKEVLGDYGVCTGIRVEPFADPAMGGSTEFPLDEGLYERARDIFRRNGMAYTSGIFMTVNGASGTAERGDWLRDRYNAICENMEGGAIARVCREFSLPMLEIRVISNLVEDRPGSPWRLEEACRLSAHSAAVLLSGLLEEQ
jgi:futalosine hydrolase